MEVVWSQETLESYMKVLDFLLEKWSVREIENFENKFDALIERLRTNKEICPKSRILNFRKCLIDEHNSLIYQEVDNKIFLLTIIDNRSSHPY